MSEPNSPASEGKSANLTIGVSIMQMKTGQTILVTGGAGFIGSHTVVELISAGYDIHIADNFSNSSKAVIERIERIVKRPVPFTALDMRDLDGLNQLFGRHSFD